LSKGRAIAASVAAILAATAVAVPTIAEFEGFVPVGYRDPVGIPTSCMGHTGPDAVLGRRYTDQECAAQLTADAVKHGLDIAPCLPAELPVETRAAFISFGFNVGAAKFCASTLSRKARAGDLAGACAELSRWTKAGGRELPGLVRRRAAERAMCERGLANA
jgi:lysozyme